MARVNTQPMLKYIYMYVLHAVQVRTMMIYINKSYYLTVEWSTTTIGLDSVQLASATRAAYPIYIAMIQL